jgi:hypothetical protein
MKHWILFYDVVDDYTTRRVPLRKIHLQHALAAHSRGELVLAGAMANPPDGALLIFEGNSAAVAENFAKADPYVINGLVKAWRVREWTTVVGDQASIKVDLNTL